MSTPNPVFLSYFEIVTYWHRIELVFQPAENEISRGKLISLARLFELEDRLKALASPIFMGGYDA